MLPVRLQRVKNRRAKDFGLTFIFFYLKMILKHIVKLCHLLKLFFRKKMLKDEMYSLISIKT